MSQSATRSVREGLRESRRCSRDTYPDSCITEYILIYEDHLTAFVFQVTGLAEGERIYSVRFQGDVGYVVTFRQVMVWGLGLLDFRQVDFT